MTCNVKPYENPCRATGVGPSCFTPITISTEDGAGTSGLGGTGAPAGDPIGDLPDNIDDLTKEPCCEDCEEPVAPDDGGTGDGTDDGGTGEGGDEEEEEDGGGGFTVVDPGDTVPDGNDKGSKDKKECIERIRKRIDEEVQKCLCSCFQGNQANAQFHGSSNPGASHWCWGYCIDTVESNFQECFCRDVICQTDGDEDEDKDEPLPTDPTEDPKPDVRYEVAEFGPHIKQVNFPVSSYEEVIPLVYNRGVLGGNIIWASAPRAVRKCIGGYSTDAEGTITVSSTYIEQTYIDFALALCEGEIAGVSRIWLKDSLIYNNTVETDSTGVVVDGDVITVVENLTMFNKQDKGLDKYDKTTMEIRVYSGSESQSVDPTIATALGVSAPANRGLAYIVFRNFEITGFDGTIPQLKVEVVRNPADIRPTQQSALVNSDLREVKPDLLWFDNAQRRLYVGGVSNSPSIGDGIRVLDYNSLSEVVQYAAGVTENVLDEDFDHTTFTLSPQGSFYVQTGISAGTRPLQIIDTATAYGRQVYGAATGNIEHTSTALADMSRTGGHVGGFVRTRDVTGGYREVYVAVDDNDVAFLRTLPFGQVERIPSSSGVNFTTDTVQAFATMERDKSEGDGQTFTLHKHNDFYLVTVPSGTTNAITIYRGTGFSTRADAQFFDPEAALDSFVIDASVWGGQAGGTSVMYAMADDRYSSLFIAVRFSGGDGAFIKWNVVRESVEWAASVPSMPPYASAGSRASSESTKFYHWIGADGNVYSINKRTGIVALVASVVADYGLPAIGGAQFYDSLSQSITYITSGDQLARLFVGRVFAGTVTLAEIVGDLMTRSGLESHEYDVSELLAVEVYGYVIDDNSDLRAALLQLALIYDFTVRQRSNQIVFTRSGTITGLSLSETNTSGEVKRETKVDANAFRAARVTYYDVDASMGINTQVVTSAVQPPPGQATTGDISIDYPFSATAAFAAALAERLLFDATVNIDEVEVKAAPSMAALEPGDYVTLYIDGLQPHNYLVEEATIGADKSVHARIRRYDTDNDISVALQPQPPIVQNGNGNVIPLTPVSGYKPVAIATNAILNSQTRAGYDSTTALYAAIAHTGVGAYVPQNLYIRSPSGSLAQKGKPTRALDYGTALSILPDSDDYGTDFATELVVRFTKPGAEDIFTAFSDHESFFSNEWNNTLYVGGELVQFRNWSVDGDGVTYRFTGLMRGRRGTEQYINGHEGFEFVAAYSPLSWTLIEDGVTNELGDQYLVAVQIGVPAAGQFAEEPVFVDHDFIKFYSPLLRRSKQVGGDFVLSMINRVRTEDITTDLNDSPTPENVYFAIPKLYVLSAPYEEQRFIDAVAGAEPGYILRQSTGTTTFTYGLAAQLADGFDAATDTLHVVGFIERNITDNIFPIPRGHANYRAIRPEYKS